jgi:F0F1-type ATP synthase epsilon subunit
MAINADNIDEAQCQEAVRRAEARMAEKLSDAEAALVQAALVHATTQLRVKRQRRK